MKELNREKLKFIKNIALEYRLSKKNICKLLGIEPTDENQMIIYNYFMENGILTPDEKNEFMYLDYETATEKQISENASLMSAKIAIHRMKKALSSNDETEVKSARDKIKKIDIDFANLRVRPIWSNVTESEILTITKYRIKHVLSKREIHRLIGIGDETLTKYERLINDNYWSSKIQAINEYYYDVYQKNKSKKKS